jgi:hypothetical protein
LVLPHVVVLGLSVRARQFFARRTSKDLERVDWPDQGTDSPRIISLFTAHFREAFPGAFKNREAESSSRDADSGDVFMITSDGIPQDVDIYVTTQDLPTHIRTAVELWQRILTIQGSH